MALRSKPKPVEAEVPPAGTCLWEKAGAQLAVSLRFARPVVPAWRPPPPPPRPLLELIPPRDLTPKPPPTTAVDEFKAKVRGCEGGRWPCYVLVLVCDRPASRSAG